MKTPAAGTCLVLCLACAWPRAAHAAAADTLVTTLPADLARAVTSEVREAARRQRNIGLQVAIMRDGVLVYSLADGSADLIAHIPVDRMTRFQVAGAAQVFTGVTALRFAERARLNLDSPVAQYLPDFQPGKGWLTPRHLAAHQGGIRDYRDGELETLCLTHYDDAMAVTEVFSADTLLARPGERAVYSSFGFDLLAAVVERATGETYADALEQQLLAPLALERTRPDDVLAAIDGRARSYRVDESELPAPAPENDYSYSPGGGNMLSTADDLVRLGDALTRPGLLSAESLALFGNPPAAVDSTSPDLGNFGLFRGHDAVNRPVLFTTGSAEAYQSGLLIYPRERLVIAVVSNTWGLGFRNGDLVRALVERLAILVSPGCAWWTEEGTPLIDEAAERQVERVEPGLISTSRHETFPAVSPSDGSLWFSTYDRNFGSQTIRLARADSTGRLGAPETAWFSGRWGDRAARFSPDGKRIYFTSNRPRSGTGDPGDDNLWTLEQKPDSTWSDPVLLPEPFNSGGADMHGAVTRTSLWFVSDRPGGFGDLDVYRVPLRGAGGTAVHLDAPLNDARSQSDLWMSADETWMILVVTDHPDGLGGDDLFVSEKEGAGWSAPRPLPAPINSRAYEYGPSVSPDGKYLYFTSHRRGSADVYRVPMSRVAEARRVAR